MNFNEPTKEQIESLKARHQDRSIHQVEIVHDEDVYFFVMLGPNEEEFKKFCDEMLDADEMKGAAKVKNDATRQAAKRAALMLIKHPDRAEVARIFDMKPDFPMDFPKKIREAAGSNTEVRSKKL